MSKPMLIYSPKMQFFTNDGLVAAGYKLFVYTPGTTTKQNTYPTAADAAALTNANTNPIVLDSAGRVSVDMYINASFKLVLAPSTDTDPPAAAIWTEDNISTLGQLVSTSAKSANYVIVASDRDKLMTMDASGGSKTFTLLAAATAGDGFNLKFKKSDSSANTVTIQCNAAETIDGANTFVLYSQNEYVEIYGNGTVWYSCRSAPLNFRDSNGNLAFSLTTGTYKFYNSAGTNYFGLSTPAGITSYSYTPASTQGTAGQHIRHSGTAGTLVHKSAMHFENMQVFKASGTFTPPSDVDTVFVECWAAGGSGGSSNAVNPAGAGGGGAYASGITSVTPSSGVTVTVGTGGTSIGSNTNTIGNAGTNSSFGSAIIAAGGSAGGSGVSGAGGAGGTVANCTVPATGLAIAGGTGMSGGTATGLGTPGNAGGASPKMGVTGQMALGGTAPANTGGGGGGGNSSSASGAGATGLLVVYY